MNTINFSNKYGTLQLKPVSDYMPVRDISHKIVPIGCAFTIATAEQIALITENRMIQVSMIPNNIRVCYVIHHSSTSIAAICEIVSINFTWPIDAQTEIERSVKYPLF